MINKPLWLDLAERNYNFFGYPNVPHDELYKEKEYYECLASLYSMIEEDIQKPNDLDQKQMLDMVLTKGFNCYASHNSCGRSPRRDAAYDACRLTALGMFLHESKRVERITLRDFIYKHSNMQYNQRDSKNYINRYHKKGSFVSYDGDNPITDTSINSEVETFRQMRHRRLITRPVYRDTRNGRRCQ